jgi:hypothetical protein
MIGCLLLRSILRVLLLIGLTRSLPERAPQHRYNPRHLPDMARWLLQLVPTEMMLVNEGIERLSAVAGLSLAVDRVNSVRDSGTTELVWIINIAGILTGAGIGMLRFRLG